MIFPSNFVLTEHSGSIFLNLQFDRNQGRIKLILSTGGNRKTFVVRTYTPAQVIKKGLRPTRVENEKVLRLILWVFLKESLSVTLSYN